MLSAGFRKRFLGILMAGTLLGLGGISAAQEKEKSDADAQASPDGQTDPLKRPVSQKQKKQNAKALKAELTDHDKKWLNQDVLWIITDEERKAFMLLSNEEERENFIESFWQRRDPTPDTAENEFKEEHYRRIAYANEHFPAGIPGWKTDRGRIYTSALGVLLLVPALLLLGYAWALPVAIGAMILFGIGWGFYDCNNMPILCQIARPEHRATGYGFMNLVSISVGAAATVALGWMRDHGIKLSVAFAVSAAVALLSAGLILLVKPNTGNLERN